MYNKVERTMPIVFFLLLFCVVLLLRQPSNTRLFFFYLENYFFSAFFFVPLLLLLLSYSRCPGTFVALSTHYYRFLVVLFCLFCDRILAHLITLVGAIAVAAGVAISAAVVGPMYRWLRLCYQNK